MTENSDVPHYTIEEATDKFFELVERAEKGETFVIDNPGKRSVMFGPAPPDDT